jgi:hypothetical protein
MNFTQKLNATNLKDSMVAFASEQSFIKNIVNLVQSYFLAEPTRHIVLKLAALN